MVIAVPHSSKSGICCRAGHAFTDDMLEDAACQGEMLGEVVQDQWRDERAVLFRRRHYVAERRLADVVSEHISGSRESLKTSLVEICRRLRSEPQVPVRELGAVEATQESEDNIVLTDQKQGRHNVIDHPLSIITGGPGTGKTTIIKSLADAVGAESITTCALAGRATFRIFQATGIAASTIHMLIMLLPNGRRFWGYDPNRYCVATVIGLWLMRKLLDECRLRHISS
jgi:ATP-dependent exoDNAse (exonuclease V) alpha subunit